MDRFIHKLHAWSDYMDWLENNPNAKGEGMVHMIDHKAIEAALAKIANHYEKSAPTVERWADALYRKFNSKEHGSILLDEINTAANLSACDLHPNTAANIVYKLMHRLGQDVTGHAGF